MIARFTFILPFRLECPEGEELAPIDLDYGVYKVRLHPPLKGAIDMRDVAPPSQLSMNDVRQRIRAAPPEFTDSILVNGKRTFSANVLQIDFKKDIFHRPMGGAFSPSEGDPPPNLAFTLSNGMLRRLRSVSRGDRLGEVLVESSLWALEYLSDDEEELPREEGLFRRHESILFQFHATACTLQTWTLSQTLPLDYRPHVWDELLLDAKRMLSHPGAALTLSYAALECFSQYLVNSLAKIRGLPKGLWDWISDRDHHMKEPAVEDCLGDLCMILSGRSLKSEKPLWETFKNHRTARNRFVHEGRGSVGGVETTQADVRKYLGNVEQIFAWGESVLPEHLRRPKAAGPTNFQIESSTVNLTSPHPAEQ